MGTQPTTRDKLCLHGSDLGDVGCIQREMSSRSRRAQTRPEIRQHGGEIHSVQKHRSGGSIAFAAIRPFRPARDNIQYCLSLLFSCNLGVFCKRNLTIRDRRSRFLPAIIARKFACQSHYGPFHYPKSSLMDKLPFIVPFAKQQAKHLIRGSVSFLN
ncbi:hypothetical protein L596_005457 [Steinernema carpocapsae]|uniref:Uncharacterized protein n=1 Tax=Steinernema carpocapsae TaxID=34508 RepID=A0A4U8V2P6_STECR|nr:hypothetical protein L596_005457 [Steinernema carpocapsae]